jgi:4-diphosphocytidyl-2-C-methyl-D-erythritol kinase
LEIIRNLFGIPFLKVHLHKVIPVGAGLGGGSSDAAYAIRAVNRLFSLSLEPERMKTIASSLGSDCPFFIDARPVFATGRGEMLKPLGRILEGFYLLLVNPGITISTSEAYESCVAATHKSGLEEISSRPVTECMDLITNDFERTIFSKYPAVGAIKKLLYETGAIFSLMSGSGSTVYALFRDKPVLTGEIKGQIICQGRI